MFYYTYNNEEDLYIHPQDPFRETPRGTHEAQARTNSGRDERYRSHTPAFFYVFWMHLEDGCSEQHKWSC